MKKVIILEEAFGDLDEAFEFYERQKEGAGDYFTTNILLVIEKLSTTSGIHASEFGFNRKLSQKLPFAIYYKTKQTSVEIYVILDLQKTQAG